jgi:hypothetical protein
MEFDFDDEAGDAGYSFLDAWQWQAARLRMTCMALETEHPPFRPMSGSAWVAGANLGAGPAAAGPDWRTRQCS